MSRPVQLYALLDPTTRRCRYVGKTVKSLQRKLGDHVYHSRRRSHPVCQWLATLNQPPLIHPIQVVPATEWQRAEQALIRLARSLYPDLLNVEDGGLNQGKNLQRLRVSA